MIIILKGKIVMIFECPGTVQLVNRKAKAAVIQLKEEKYVMIQKYLRCLQVVVIFQR